MNTTEKPASNSSSDPMNKITFPLKAQILAVGALLGGLAGNSRLIYSRVVARPL
jgi:hypothetical protein